MAESYKKLNQYISTADGTAGTLLIPKLIMEPMIMEAEKNLIPRELAAMTWGPSAIKGSSFTVNLETANTMDIRQVGEGAEVPLDNMDFSTVTFTPKKYGVAIRITREMMEDSQFELFNRNVRTAGKRFAENENTLVIAALDQANATTAGGAAVTIANIAESMYDVENNDYIPTDFIVGNEVAQDLRNIDTFVEADKSGSTEMLRTGFIGNIFGMNVIRVSSNAGMTATSAYILDRSEAYAIAIARDITVENFTLPSYDMEGAVLTQRIDVQPLRTTAISKITSS